MIVSQQLFGQCRFESCPLNKIGAEDVMRKHNEVESGSVTLCLKELSFD